jgi:DNA-binding sugar fermentation-stimulating protein
MYFSQKPKPKMLLYELQSPIVTTIEKRPSATCKTPYVADITVENQSYYAHTPALGCCGLSDKGSSVIVSPVDSKKNKCAYAVYLSLLQEKDHTFVIGIHPKMAETLVDQMLTQNLLRFLENNREKKREFKFLNSRFDFTGVDQDGRPYILEVKNVPLADYVDVPKKIRKQYKNIENTKAVNEKIAYFPDGYRKNSTQVVSERALKHIHELTEIVKTTNYRAILCFVIQRTDVSHFQPSNIDLTYKKAVQEAHESGVEIRAVQAEWTMDGKCQFVRDDLPVKLYEEVPF